MDVALARSSSRKRKQDLNQKNYRCGGAISVGGWRKHEAAGDRYVVPGGFGDLASLSRSTMPRDDDGDDLEGDAGHLAGKPSPWGPRSPLGMEQMVAELHADMVQRRERENKRRNPPPIGPLPVEMIALIVDNEVVKHITVDEAQELAHANIKLSDGRTAAYVGLSIFRKIIAFATQ